MNKEYKNLICERRHSNGEVICITLNNEKMMNAMIESLQCELLEVLEEIEYDNSIRCVVITGAGEKAFSAGGDINLFKKLDNVSGYDFMYERGQRIQHAITHMEKPVIAAVNGLCLAGGLELALCCDIIYASANAKFGLLEISLGLLPGWGGTIRLPRAIPVNKAKEMIFSAEMISAEDAFHWGLVNRVLKNSEDLYKELDSLVDRMMRKPALALRAAKSVINNSITCNSIEAALTIERDAIMWLISSEDMKEGVSAFVEKRTPHFQGK